MGFLSIKSNTMSKEEAEEYQDQIKSYGILQAIKLFENYKDLNKKTDELKWGEEVEYHVGTLWSKEKKAKIVVEGFQKVEEVLKDVEQTEFIYQAEFGSWMVEAVPNKPYTLYDAKGPKEAYDSLKKRRQIINDELFMNNMFMTSIPSWPNLGVKGSFSTENEKLYSIDNYEEHNISSQSEFILDEMTNPHPRFPTMMSNVRKLRGSKVDIRVPIYPDENTGVGKIDGDRTPGEIYMDAQHFGMGANCLQITFETQNINHAKYLHDSFIPLGPIFGALSASAPVYKGQLSNWDFRWNVIGDSVDSRNESERHINDENFMPKSRYSGMNHYISDHPNFKGDKLNDGYKLKIDQGWYDKLIESGMTDRLAYHFASLFSHDALVIYKDRLEMDPNTTEHFENLNSTNWNSVRFKPPPALDSPIGWRVEFRTLDVQITDFENAAFIALVNLMTRVINDFDIDLSLPISLWDINLERAHQIDAVTKQKFWWRTNIVKEGADFTINPAKANGWNYTSEEWEDNYNASDFKEMKISDILQGSEEFKNTGLITLIEEYFRIHKFSEEDVSYYTMLIDFLWSRARGDVKTGARYMRDLVLNHPEYQKDSIVSDQICYELVSRTTLLGTGDKWDKDLLGPKSELLD